MNDYIYGAVSDIGVDRENQEDFIQLKELDNQNLLCIIADGTGSRENHPQPAAIVTAEIIDTVTDLYLSRKELFFEDPSFFLKLAMEHANRILGAFKMGNEERFFGYAASVTCYLFSEANKIYVAHSGNTRMYILRNGMLKQVTKDHTKAATLLDEGKIDLATYHVHPDRLKLTSGIGIVLDPEIQTFTGKMKENDIVLLSTDGVHYAIQPEAMAEIILGAANCNDAASALIKASKDIIKYPDNMSAIIVYKNK